MFDVILLVIIVFLTVILAELTIIFVVLMIERIKKKRAFDLTRLDRFQKLNRMVKK